MAKKTSFSKKFSRCVACLFLLGVGIAITACAAAPGVTPSAIYVSTAGSDGNAGTNVAAPVRSLQVAIERARGFGLSTIWVAGGVYTPGAGLNYLTMGLAISNTSDLTFIGGYNADFSARTGVSILDGMGALRHIVWIEHATNITLDGLTVTRGNATGTGDRGRGGGIFIRNSQSVRLINCHIVGNMAHSGGGISIIGGTNHLITGIIDDNAVSFNEGGGVFFLDTALNNSHIFSNVIIQNNIGHGVFRSNANSNPQGTNLIRWGSGNSPSNINW